MLEFKLNGVRGYVKERLELTPMGSFDVEEGGINSRPGSHRIPDGVRSDGPGFSLCAAPLESSGPGFRDERVGGMNEQRSGVYWTGDGGEDYSEEGVKADSIKWYKVVININILFYFVLFLFFLNILS